LPVPLRGSERCFTRWYEFSILHYLYFFCPRCGDRFSGVASNSASRGSNKQPANQLASSSSSSLCVRNAIPLFGLINIMEGSWRKMMCAISCAKLLFSRVRGCEGLTMVRLPFVTVIADQQSRCSRRSRCRTSSVEAATTFFPFLPFGVKSGNALRLIEGMPLSLTNINNVSDRKPCYRSWL